MTTAIIGTGSIGGQLARHLVVGGERVVVAARDEAHAAALANDLGSLASAALVGQAIAAADTVVLAVWLETSKELIAEYAELLKGKVVVDPSNPITQDGQGGIVRTLPDGQWVRNERKAGVVYWSEASLHQVRNIGTTMSHTIRIELKY